MSWTPAARPPACAIWSSAVLLENVYACNDFSHNGHTLGAKPKKAVTLDMEKALLISECNGHMFPTKPFDTWVRRQEQALRHIRVQNATLSEHAGRLGRVYVFSNADEVALYKNDVLVTRLCQNRWSSLPHPPSGRTGPQRHLSGAEALMIARVFDALNGPFMGC